MQQYLLQLRLDEKTHTCRLCYIHIYALHLNNSFEDIQCLIKSFNLM